MNVLTLNKKIYIIKKNVTHEIYRPVFGKDVSHESTELKFRLNSLN